MFKILVTNDDGIDSIGIKALIEELSKIAIVYVAAPTEQQSAKSMALTCREPIKAEEVDVDGAEVAYAINGTPADCVKWALGTFEGVVDFDYVISGINRGYNLSTAVYYSGTLGGAREGAFNGYKSIALSVQDHDATEFDYICNIIPELLEMSDSIGSESILSVNAPNIPMWQVKGIKIVEAAPHLYGDYYRFDPVEDGYQINEHISELDPSLENDYNCIIDGYATVTPITTAVTDRVAMRKLQGLEVQGAVCVFIDAQMDKAEKMSKAKRWEKNIVKWAKCVDRLDLPALMTEQYGEGEIIPAVKANLRNGELVEKVDFNAFNSKKFEMLLCSASEKKIFFAGLETHIGIQQTALALLERDFDVYIIEDCCTSKNKHDHDVAIEYLREQGCHIVTFESAAMSMVGSNLNHKYNSISSIVEK